LEWSLLVSMTKPDTRATPADIAASIIIYLGISRYG
jgi:hypothetical protein